MVILGLKLLHVSNVAMFMELWEVNKVTSFIKYTKDPMNEYKRFKPNTVKEIDISELLKS